MCRLNWVFLREFEAQESVLGKKSKGECKPVQKSGRSCCLLAVHKQHQLCLDCVCLSMQPSGFLLCRAMVLRV